MFRCGLDSLLPPALSVHLCERASLLKPGLAFKAKEGAGSGWLGAEMDRDMGGVGQRGWFWT